MSEKFGAAGHRQPGHVHILLVVTLSSLYDPASQHLTHSVLNNRLLHLIASPGQRHATARPYARALLQQDSAWAFPPTTYKLGTTPKLGSIFSVMT